MNLREALAEEIYAAADALKIPRELVAPLIAKGATSSIAPDLYSLFEKYGADRFMLGTLGSWGDNAGDSRTLDMLRHWNASERKS